MAKLTSAARKAIPTKDFALPGRRYPISDRAHAANAKARVSQVGTPAEKAAVNAKVRAKFPSMGKIGGGHHGTSYQGDGGSNHGTSYKHGDHPSGHSGVKYS